MDMGRLHGILHLREEVRDRRQIFQMKKTICTGLVAESQIFGGFRQVNDCLTPIPKCSLASLKCSTAAADDDPVVLRL
jgi:hypothetical protein